MCNNSIVKAENLEFQLQILSVLLLQTLLCWRKVIERCYFPHVLEYKLLWEFSYPLIRLLTEILPYFFFPVLKIFFNDAFINNKKYLLTVVWR